MQVGRASAMMHGLIIDDSSAIRRVARRILERLDFEVAEAEDTQAGLDACRNHMPDVIFVEHMPVIDGVDFVGALRGKLGATKPKVIICILENDVVQIARAMRAGADDFILKPFYREIFQTKLQDVGLL
jgi:two-component system, chemotaxis family, chemotaxis protein CheY